MRTTNGSVSGFKLLMNESPVVYFTLNGPSYGKNIDTYDFHNKLRNCGSDRLEKIVNIHYLKLNDEFKICEQCAIA
jgi:hypothetical protein